MDRGLHWADLSVLFTTALLPWPTAVLSSALAEGGQGDVRVAVALYVIIGSLMCPARLFLFHTLAVTRS
jgi:hypothetical protein